MFSSHPDSSKCPSEKEHKKLKKQFANKQVTKSKNISSKEETLPDWFDKELKKEETTAEEKKELDNILNSFN